MPVDCCFNEKYKNTSNPVGLIQSAYTIISSNTNYSLNGIADKLPLLR